MALTRTPRGGHVGQGAAALTARRSPANGRVLAGGEGTGGKRGARGSRRARFWGRGGTGRPAATTKSGGRGGSKVAAGLR